MTTHSHAFPLLTEGDRMLPFYFTSAGEWAHQLEVQRDGGYPDYQWLQTIEGEGMLQVGGKSLTVAEGQGMLLLPNEAHHYKALTDQWAVRWVTFNGTMVEHVLQQFHLHVSKVMTLPYPEMMLSRMNDVRQKIRAPQAYSTLDLSPLVYQLIVELVQYRSLLEEKSKRHYLEQLQPALQYIDVHYIEPIPLAAIAQQLGVTEQHTCYLFQQGLGMRPIEYITKYRIRKAKEMLIQNDELEVKTIAHLIGYEHTSYFIKMFRKYEGITPNKFRTAYLMKS